MSELKIEGAKWGVSPGDRESCLTKQHFSLCTPREVSEVVSRLSCCTLLYIHCTLCIKCAAIEMALLLFNVNVQTSIGRPTVTRVTGACVRNPDSLPDVSHDAK